MEVKDAQIPENEAALLTIFPEEIWNFILFNINKASDFQAVDKTSSLFHRLLQPHRCCLLFSSVARIMFDIYVEEESWYVKHAGWSKEDLIPLRQVCFTWMRGVEDILQNPGFQFKFKKEIPSVYALERYNWHTRIESVQQMVDFNEHFESSHQLTGKNPFLTRGLCLRISGEVIEKMMEILRFFAKYGKHIWYFSVRTACMNKFQRLDFFKHVCLILEQLPNLKAFGICEYLHEPFDLRQLAQIKEHLKRNRNMPEFKQLEFLRHWGMPIPVFIFLIDKAPQLHKLEMVGYAKLDRDVNYCLEHSPTLKSLAVDFTLEQYRKLAQATFKCELEALDLKVSPDWSTSWKEVFHILEKQFGNTITKLTLQLPSSDYVDLELRLSLRKLKTLKLVISYPVALEFMLSMSDSLEELDIRVVGRLGRSSGRSFFDESSKYYARAGIHEGKLKIFSYWWDLQQSNVWSLFPKLKVLKFGNYCNGKAEKYYTREKVKNLE